MRSRSILAMAAAAAIAISACSTTQPPSAQPSPAGSGAASPGTSPGSSPQASAPLTKVSLEIGPVTDAEFAGYLAAQRLGYFTDEQLQVQLVNSDPATRSYVGTTGPEFMVADVAQVLAAREHGSDLVDIAQIYQRSATALVTWKKDGFASACALKSKRIGLWPAPADLEPLALLAQCQPPVTPSGFQVVSQGQDVAAFLAHSVAAVEATTYDGYAKVLEATNPATKAQYTTDDLALFQAAGGKAATLHDAIFARAGWLGQPGNRDIAVSIVRASIRGWIYCRDHQEDCVQFVTGATPSLGTTDQRWALNTINPLIWPSPSNIGVTDPAAWDQTVSLALAQGVITKQPGSDALDKTIVADAGGQLADQDLVAAHFQTGVVAVAPGGK